MPVPTETAVPAMMPGDSERFVTVGEWDRSYFLHIPPGLTQDQPVPVVFVFHSLEQNAIQIRAETGFNSIADRSSFVVVYPLGVRDSWNAGEEQSFNLGAAVLLGIDEPAFIEAMLSDLASIVNIDPKRVYPAGRTLGGAMTYWLGCDMSDNFAAIASVNGPMIYSVCEPTRTVSRFHIHGLTNLRVYRWSG
jgi:polyhydroxybutyrate depolymerase